MLLLACFPIPSISSLHSHTCIPVSMAGGAVLLGNTGAAGWRRQECVTPWAQGHFRAGGVGWCFFCFVLLSLWASALSGGWKQEGLREGGSVQRVSALCCGVISTHLFSLIFFFLLLFVVAIFHVSTVSAVFSPHSPSSGPPFPCDKTET